MASQKTTFGATIIPSAERQHGLPCPPPQPFTDSPVLTPAVSRDGSIMPPPKASIPIQSPFYEHPPASHELISGKPSFTASVRERSDLESGMATPMTEKDENPFSSKISVDCRTQECPMWPSKETLVMNKKVRKSEHRARRGCVGCAPLHDAWARFNKRQRLMIKIGIALFLIGVAIAIALGITVAVNGGVYSSGGIKTVPHRL